MITTDLWTFAVNYSVHQWNNTPMEELKWFTPEEVFTGVTDDNASYKNNAMSSFHPFGCPVYVLEAELQKGESIPRWDPRVRTGIFLGHSKQHARNINLILNPNTDIISCQYHCYFDDNFHTIPPDNKSDKVAIWKGIESKSNHDFGKEPITFALSPFDKDSSPLSSDAFADNFTHIEDRPNKHTNKRQRSKRPSLNHPDQFPFPH